MRLQATADEIASWITDRVKLIEGLEKCVVRTVTFLAEADSAGCNWSDSITVANTPFSAAETKRLLTPIIREARKRFNISR